MSRVVAAGLMMLLGAGVVTAADRADKSTLLSIDLARQVIVEVTRKQETPLLDANTFIIRRDETTAIEIGQQNPLLFTYEATNEKTDTEDYLAALEFAKRLKVLLDLFPAGLGANIDRPRVRGLDPEEVRADLKALTDLIEGLPAGLSDSLGTPEQVAALKKRYAAAVVTALTARLERAFDAMEDIATACLTGTGELKTDKGDAITCDGPALINDNIELAAAVARARDSAAAAAEVQRRRLARTAKPTLIEFVRLALALDARMHRHVTMLNEFAAGVAPLMTPLRLIAAPYSIQRQTITVQVKSSGKYDALLDPSTRKKRDDAVRKFTIVLEPYQPAHLSLAPAFVIGFVRNPEFTAVKKGDGFVIQQKDSELTRYTLGVMLNITPDAWQEPTFGGHFQVGISPIKDQFGFYFGAGLRVQRLFTFGGGLMIQQVPRLAGGLTLDSPLTDPSELKTDTHFKQGLYLHVTVDLPK